ncbi:RNA lariat debranching enzyme, putative, partial [Ixodes scapularis]
MRIAVEGCAHGELDKIYETIQAIEERHKFTVDLLIICGDFQAVRNASDMDCMAVPKKYQEMKDFHKYYSGEKRAPLLTLVIGGNHEASNYLAELAFGGWLCENIYYMGYAGVVNVNGVRIAGISGIYKGPDYMKGHFEVPPYNESTKRSAYHLRNIEIFRLRQVRSTSVSQTVVRDSQRGAKAAPKLKKLRHQCKYIQVKKLSSVTCPNPVTSWEHFSVIQFSLSSPVLRTNYSRESAHVPLQDGTCTKFLALDKCLPRRDFLQILDVPTPTSGPAKLSYDAEWLCVLRATDHLLHVDAKSHYMPGPGCNERWEFTPSEEEKRELREAILSGDLHVPASFERTAPPHVPGSERSPGRPRPHLNPQTQALCRRLGLRDPLERALSPGKGAPSLDVSSFLGHEEATRGSPPPEGLNDTRPSDEEGDGAGEGGDDEDQDLAGEEPLPLLEMSSLERRK